MQSCTSLHSHMFMYLLSHNCTGKAWHRLHREDREKVCKCISWVFRFSLAIVSKHAHLYMCSQQIMAAKYVSMGSILLWIHASFWTMCYTLICIYKCLLVYIWYIYIVFTITLLYCLPFLLNYDQHRMI